MSFPPTARQLQMLRFITGYQQAKGYSPSVQECGQAIGSRSKSQSCETLKGLEVRGLIRRIKGKARAIEVLEPPAIPSIAGEPLFAVPRGGRGTAFFVAPAGNPADRGNGA